MHQCFRILRNPLWNRQGSKLSTRNWTRTQCYIPGNGHDLVSCLLWIYSFKVLHSGCALLFSRGRDVNQMYICQRVHLNTKSFFSCKTEKQIQVIPDKNHHFHFIIISSIFISQFISAFSVRIYCYVVKVHPLSIINNWRAGGDPSWGGGVQPGQVTSS